MQIPEEGKRDRRRSGSKFEEEKKIEILRNPVAELEGEACATIEHEI